MKSIALVLIVSLCMVAATARAQTNAHLQLSKQYPAAGEKLGLVYNPVGAPLNGNTDITATVYFLDHKNNPAADIDLKHDGKTWRGEFTVNNTAKAFFVKINSGKVVDNNNGNGYIYMVYKNDWPIAGAYAEKAFILNQIGAELAKIKQDKKTAIALYQQEFKIYPQSEKDYGMDYYPLLGTMPQYAAIVNKKITTLEKSSSDKDQLLAMNMLMSMKKKKQADSLTAVIKARFPHGQLAENLTANEIYDAPTLAKKLPLFNNYIINYPANTTERNDERESILLDMADACIATGDVGSFNKYVAQVKNKPLAAGTLNEAAWQWVLKGIHLDDAEKLSKESLSTVAQQMSKPAVSAYTSPKEARKQAAFEYDQYSDTYAMILFKKGKSAEALAVEQKVYDNHIVTEPDFHNDYVTILNANGKFAQAQQVCAQLVKDGQTTPVINKMLKGCYVKTKGSLDGYAEYLSGLEAAGLVKKRDELAKTMVDQPAPLFSLKGLDGKTVSLASLKGKVVVVDFWATWCGPCKASMPGMQLAVNKYKSNPNVQFLFIDCWENGEPAVYMPAVKKFIAAAKYSFHVLEDEKDEEGKQGRVVGAYGVDGIPTKFIIDQSGNIRFKYVGYNGTPNGVLNEVSAMIEMAKNPQMAGQKLSMNN